MRYCQLLLRDLLSRLAEHFRVLQVDVREQDDPGVDHVRRIQPAAEPGLDDGDVHLGLGELEQRRRGQGLELGGAEGIRRRPHALEGALDVHFLCADLDPLAPTTHVRGRVRAGPQPFALEIGGNRPRRRRLALGADDVNRRVGALRVSELGDERAHRVEAELLRPGAERLDPGDAPSPGC